MGKVNLNAFTVTRGGAKVNNPPHYSVALSSCLFHPQQRQLESIARLALRSRRSIAVVYTSSFFCKQFNNPIIQPQSWLLLIVGPRRKTTKSRSASCITRSSRAGKRTTFTKCNLRTTSPALSVASTSRLRVATRFITIRHVVLLIFQFYG